MKFPILSGRAEDISPRFPTEEIPISIQPIVSIIMVEYKIGAYVPLFSPLPV